MRRKLQFSILISLPKSFSPSTVKVWWKFWRIWKKRGPSEVWFFDWTFETKTAIFKFDIPAENFFAKHGECSFKNLKSSKKNQNFQKFGFLIDPLRRRLQFSILITLPKIFSSSTVNVRSKTWRVWKKIRTFRSFVFWLIFWDEDCNFQFWYPCRNVFPKHENCSFKVLKILIEKDSFRKFGFLIDLMRRRQQFSILISLPKIFSPSTVNVCSKTWRVWRKIRTFKSCFFH